jgi:hypothetical protein
MAKSYHSLGGLAPAAAAGGVLVAVGMLLLTVVGTVEPAGAHLPGQKRQDSFLELPRRERRDLHYEP